MHMHKPRGLNIDESYACNRSAVRKCFEAQDIQIFWGNNRSYCFDFRMRRPPEIDGIVVASVSVNHRIPNPVQRGIMNFFIISDPQYDTVQKQVFESDCLPRLKDWYCAHLRQRSRSGCDEILAIWNGCCFKLQELHFV